MALNLSLSVLVVDDASTMIRIIRNLLRQIGFRDIDEVQGGATALAKMRSLVISDWNMEPITGIDLLRQVRGDPGLGEIPFIMVTAETRTKNVIAAKDAGVVRVDHADIANLLSLLVLVETDVLASPF